MRAIIKKLLNRFYKPLVMRYLQKDRQYSRAGVKLLVKKGVFHPGFFYSTSLLLRALKREELRGKHVLELGAGSALLSFYAAKQGARVTATDINPLAIEGLHHNLRREKAVDPKSFTIIHSDLFDDIPHQQFDYILINPPYYKADPKNDEQHAWYCGENMEYFQKLFVQLPVYISDTTTVWMTLSDECDLRQIRHLALQRELDLDELQSRGVMGETTYIYRIAHRQTALNPTTGHDRAKMHERR